mmetsp:Transcript_87722/g.204107  ORF Transcript_87722/g.204107 Transcript_87722/m.204107 type:complete len:224 (+) Transcript_87722:212-883(+)
MLAALPHFPDGPAVGLTMQSVNARIVPCVHRERGRRLRLLLEDLGSLAIDHHVKVRPETLGVGLVCVKVGSLGGAPKLCKEVCACRESHGADVVRVEPQRCSTVSHETHGALGVDQHGIGTHDRRGHPVTQHKGRDSNGVQPLRHVGPLPLPRQPHSSTTWEHDDGDVRSPRVLRVDEVWHQFWLGHHVDVALGVGDPARNVNERLHPLRPGHVEERWHGAGQ